MSLTRANIEVVLISRCGGKLAAAGLDGITKDGANPDLNDPIATALISLGIQPDSINAVSDLDVSQVETDNYAELLDRAELRVLETVAGNLDLVNVSVGPRREELNQLADQVEKSIARLQAKISRTYGERYLLTGGTLALDFQEKDAL